MKGTYSMFKRVVQISSVGLMLLPVAYSQLRISGRILTEDGTPITGAVLTYSRTPDLQDISDGLRLSYRPKPDQTQINTTASIEPSGQFSLVGFPDGEYALCVLFPNGGFLDTCRWGAGTAVRVQNQRFVVPFESDIVAQRGSDLKIRVNDPQDLLPNTDPLHAAPNLIVGVRTDSGAFHAAREASRNSATREYIVTVPFDTPLYLWVFTRHFTVQDETGKEIDTNGAMIPFTIPRGTASHKAVLTIAGPIQDVEPF